MSKFLWVVLLVSNGADLHSQLPNKGSYDIQKPKRAKECAKLFQGFKSMPKEVRISATVHKDDSIFIAYNDLDWFNKVITSRKDGIAIDLVSQAQYACDNPVPKSSEWSHQGYLLPPVYRDELIKNRRRFENGTILSFAGLVPKNLDGKSLEANFIILENKNKCYYSNVVNIDYHAWRLLKTGFYYDTLTAEKIKDKYKQVSKILRFTIPFEKDRTEYRTEDIKPLYDSLRITDYTIKSIGISAYTSVEGSF